MTGLDARAGGEAGRRSAAARADCGTKFSGAGQCAATTGVALCLEEDAAGGRGRMVSGREAGAGGGVAEETMAPKF